MWSSSFWKATAERALKTFAQTLVASGIVVGVAGWDKWQAALIAAAIAAGLSIITSVASIGLGDKGTPSLVKDELQPNDVPPEGDLEPPGPGDNFDSTGFGPPLVDPASVKGSTDVL